MLTHPHVEFAAKKHIHTHIFDRSRPGAINGITKWMNVDKHIAGNILLTYRMCHKHILHTVKRASVAFCAAAPHFRHVNKHLFDIFHHNRDFFFLADLFFFSFLIRSVLQNEI